MQASVLNRTHETSTGLQQLHCIDFDGTISRSDSFIGFLRFTHGRSALYPVLALLSPLLLVEKLFPALSGVTKQAILFIFFKGYSRQRLSRLGKRYFSRMLIHDIRPQAKNTINQLIENKHRVVIVSASVDIWLQPVAEYFKAELLCTKAEFSNEIFTGRFSGKNCKGAEKANRIKEKYPISNYYLISYGNSAGDKEMFNLANKKLLHPFA